MNVTLNHNFCCDLTSIFFLIQSSIQQDNYLSDASYNKTKQKQNIKSVIHSGIKASQPRVHGLFITPPHTPLASCIIL